MLFIRRVIKDNRGNKIGSIDGKKNLKLIERFSLV